MRKLIALWFMIGLIFPFNIYANDVDLSEYLRLEVISKTLYKRAQTLLNEEQARYDVLLKPNYTAFRDAMQKFIIQSTEERADKAIAPSGYLGAKIDWEKLGAGKQAVDFKRVPAPWFNLQADKILTNLSLVDTIFQNEAYDREKLIEHYRDIKDAVLAWPRPPVAKMQ